MAGDIEFFNMPKILSFNIHIKQVACGESHTHLLSKDGHLYSMGSNMEGQLGLGFTNDIVSNVNLPTLVSGISVRKVECGKFHSIAIDNEGGVHGWGYADYGAIGVRVSLPHEPSAIQFSIKQFGMKIKDVSCGAHHSTFLNFNGEVFACGKNDKG